jgi:hypothetical protein
MLIFQVSPKSKMWITHMDEQLWNYWCYIMHKKNPFEVSRIAKIKYPDHGFKRPETLTKVGWTSSIPILSNPNWHRKKWVPLGSGNLYRSEVISLAFVRNSWTGLVRAEFEYTELWFEDEVDSRWTWC